MYSKIKQVHLKSSFPLVVFKFSFLGSFAFECPSFCSNSTQNKIFRRALTDLPRNLQIILRTRPFRGRKGTLTEKHAHVAADDARGRPTSPKGKQAESLSADQIILVVRLEKREKLIRGRDYESAKLLLKCQRTTAEGRRTVWRVQPWKYGGGARKPYDCNADPLWCVT